MKYFNESFDQIISLGNTCYPAIYMDNLCLRMESLPFDWLWRGDLTHRVDLLLGAYRDFPNSDCLESYDSGLSNTGHVRLIDRRSGIVSVHDFTPDRSPAEQLPAVKGRFQRRFERLVERLSTSGKNICFVWYSREEDGVSDKELITELDRIKAAFPGNHYCLLAFLVGKGPPDAVQITPNIIRIAENFEENSLSEIGVHLSRLRVRGELAAFHRSRLFRRRLAKVLASVIPVSRWRRAVRSRLQEAMGVKQHLRVIV